MKKVATHYVSNNMLYFLRANIQQISKLCKCVSKYLATLPKIAKIIEAIEQLPVVPANYLRFIENSGGLYEARIQLGNNIFRVFCFFDGNQFVVLLTGFQKKTQKTPSGEIDRALKLMKQYFEEKKGESEQ